ncbi:MAG: ATP-grasp domain-containing protein [Candidatus Levyibacteriota bacterium]|jgi:carbamoyl-phosphate synthase large subunit
MRELKILLTGSGAPGWVSIYRCLKAADRNLEILGCDISSKTAGGYIAKKSFTVSPGNSPKYIGELLSLCVKEKVDVVLPITDAELLPLAKKSGLFEKKGIKICVSSVASLQIAADKLSLFRFLEKNGLGNPQYQLVNSWKGFVVAIKKLGYPKKAVCFKPTISWGSRGFRILDPKINAYTIYIQQKPTSVYTSLEEMERILNQAKQFPQLLVMEYLPGDEYTVDVFVSQGQALFVIPRKRIQTTGGITTEGVVENNKEIIALSKKIIEKLGLNYSVGVQLKYSINGKPKVLEVNPRLQGTSVISFAAGVNLPYLTILQSQEKKLPKIKIKYGIHMYRHWEEIFIKNKKVIKIFNED